MSTTTRKHIAEKAARAVCRANGIQRATKAERWIETLAWSLGDELGYVAGLSAIVEVAVKADRAERAASRVYAAVIEWPHDIADRDPALILARSLSERAAGIIAEIREVADLLTDPEWRGALADIDSTEWPDWVDALELTRYGSPFVTEYERDI